MKRSVAVLIASILLLSACTSKPTVQTAVDDSQIQIMEGEKVKMDQVTIDGKKIDGSGNPIEEDPTTPQSGQTEGN